MAERVLCHACWGRGRVLPDPEGCRITGTVERYPIQCEWCRGTGYVPCGCAEYSTVNMDRCEGGELMRRLWWRFLDRFFPRFVIGHDPAYKDDFVTAVIVKKFRDGSLRVVAHSAEHKTEEA